MKKLLLSALIATSFALPAWSRNIPMPTPMYGVTLDSLTSMNYIIESLTKLPYKPTVRIVFDPGVPASDYLAKVKRISEVAFVVGEILDSSGFPTDINSYTVRTQEYVDLLDPYVDIWEIANEINGEWLRPNPGGSNATVYTQEMEIGQMVVAASNIVKAKGGKTMVTMFYNDDQKGNNCWANYQDNWQSWAATFLPSDFRSTVDYATFSYYPVGACPGLSPDWVADYTNLGNLFPNALLAFGEIGTPSRYASDEKQRQIMHTYYELQLPTIPRYIKGGFWWYYREEMVPYTKVYWSLLRDIWLTQPIPQ